MLEKSYKHAVVRLIVWVGTFENVVLLNVKTRFRKGKSDQRSARTGDTLIQVQEELESR